MQNNILDFSALLCERHPGEKFTNFCMNEQCLVALCATCICSHTQNHVSTDSSPHYRALKELHQDYHTTLFQNIDSLNEQKIRLAALLQKISQRKIKMKKALKEAKKRTIQQVEKSFTELEQKLQNNIKEEKKMTDLHSQFQLESIKKFLSLSLDELFTESQNLNSTKFIKTIKRLHKQTFRNTQQTVNQISQNLNENEEFQYDINWKKQELENIGSVVKKMFSINFRYPKIPENNLKRTWTIPSFYASNNQINSIQSLKMARSSSSHFTLNPNFIKNQATLKNYSYNSSPNNLAPQFVNSKGLKNNSSKERLHGISIYSNSNLVPEASKQNASWFYTH